MSLVVNHWSIQNGSGMHRVAESIADGEKAAGLDSLLVDPTQPETWAARHHANVHVVHTHFPVELHHLLPKSKLVWVGHGTPDHVFQSAVQEYEQGSYGHGDPIGLFEHWMNHSDARVTFWPRHKWIYDAMTMKGARPVDLVPMGVDTAFWGAGESQGHFIGEPAVFTAENPHYIKWPYDLFTAWPEVAAAVPNVRGHAVYLPRDMHRAFFPWFNRTGAFYSWLVSPGIFPKEWLRNAFKSTDYYIGLVRYGDVNHVSMQANAAGARTISYTGNPHADFWVPEGDQREIAKALIAILAGDVSSRTKTPVPDLKDTVSAMRAIYEDIL